ncbi:MAG TPA: class I SAM-dependent methyltransferase, partial [Pseudonocardiaceae bacterium]|nr:class I SAM-dependent methyltransferase [Pseudonocardiaceae bacterium]
VRAVAGIDPEPDMLARARQAAAEDGATNTSWLIGADIDMAAVGALLGEKSLGAVTIAQALHWMSPDTLFPALAPLVRSGGGVAVVTNGTPLWLQDSDWSRALRETLQHWMGTRLTRTCGTDEQSQRRYADALTASGFQVATDSVDYTDTLDMDRIVGGVYSALSVDRLPAPEQRPQFAELIRGALAPHAPFTEHVHVTLLTGRTA